MEQQVAAMPPDAQRLYGAQMEAFGKSFIEETGGRGIPPSKVAEVIHKAIRSDKPRARYLVGIDAKVGARLHAAVPTRTFDGLLRRQLKLPSNVPPE